MYNVLKMGRKVFTVSVVVTTIAWSIGLAALLMPLAASAAALNSGDLIKASLPAVYYYGADGKRYVFPNEKTYKTWYSDFSSVKTITDAELAAISIGGNVTYKPGAKMVKITTDPKVYAVDKGGVLRWVKTEAVAVSLYGGYWNQEIHDVPDAFFTNYTVGTDVTGTSDYDVAAVKAGATSINSDKGLSESTGGGNLVLATAADNPASRSMVNDSDTGATDVDTGEQRVPMLKFTLSAGTAAASVTKMVFKRGGISKDGDVDNLYLMDGTKVLREVTSVNDGIGTFNLASDPLTVAAGESKVLVLAMDLDKAASNGSTMNWSLAAADVTSDASSVSGSASGNSMTVVAVSDLGKLDIGNPNTAPSSVDPGVTAKEMWRVGFTANGQDMLLTYVKMTNLGSANDADIQNLKLMDGATHLNGTISQVTNKTVEFDLTGMADGGYKIKAGQTRQLTLIGDIVAGTNRTVQWSVQKSYDVRSKDLEYGVWAYTDDYDATNDNSFGVLQPSSATTINTGTLSIGLATDSPNTYVPDGASGVVLAKFNFKASGEDIKVKSMTLRCTSSVSTNDIANTVVLLDGVQVGTTDSTFECDGATASNDAQYSFGNSFILTAGKTHTVSIQADLTGTLAVDDTLYVGIGGTVTSQAEGKDSLTAVHLVATNGHTLTAKGATLTSIENLSFTDRTSAQPTGVTNANDVRIASFVVIGGAGEPSDISQIVLKDATYATTPLGEDFQNLTIRDSAGNQVGTSIATLGTATSAATTYTFTPSTAIRIGKGEQLVFDVFADVKGTVTNSASAFAAVTVDSISATGVDTGSSADYSGDLTLQNVYLSAHGNLTIDEAADTPVAQQLVLGSTGISLAKFKLSADAAEDILISEFTIADNMTVGSSAARDAATGSIKNFKLYKDGMLLASVSSLDETYNTHTPTATFSGFTLTVPQNENVILEVKADLTSYADGGLPSSVHRIVVPFNTRTTVYDGTHDSYVNPVVAVGAGSGITMSKSGLDVHGGTQTGATADTVVVGSDMDLVRAKLTLAHAADTPSGSVTPSSEQTVAKFVATNSANLGNYSVYIRRMNFDVSNTGASLTSNANFKVYRDSISSGNQLISSAYATGASFVDTGFTEAGFTDLEIAAGSSRTIILTIDTSNGGFSSNETLSVGISQGANDQGLAPVQWDDGNANSDDYYFVDTLPLAGKTLVY